MLKYIVKRLLQMIPMLLILSVIVFLMVRLIPGDPVDIMLGFDVPKDTKEIERERLGLNDPLWEQYVRFLGDILHGDLGTSIFSGKPVMEELANRFPKTLVLAVGGTFVGAAVGILLGIIAAVKHNKLADNVIMVASLITVSTPSFFLALILMLTLLLHLRWLPSIGMNSWQGAHYCRSARWARRRSDRSRGRRAAPCSTSSIRTISGPRARAASRSAWSSMCTRSKTR